MNDCWLRYAIFLNGERVFEANALAEIDVVEAIERMNFVFDNIEFCYAESRLMDMHIFDRLDQLADRLREGDVPAFEEIKELVESIGDRYGLSATFVGESMWIRRDSEQLVVWIDRDRIVAENNRRLFGK